MRGSDLGRVIAFMVDMRISRVSGIMAVGGVSSRVAMIEINTQIAKILEIFNKRAS